MMAASKRTNGRDITEVDSRFLRVVEAFAKDRCVSLGNKKGFGSGALRVNGKIFAMMSSKGRFVVKLPKKRLDELVSNSKGERFDPGHRRLMKEWFVIEADRADWVELARDAYEFVKSRNKTSS